MANSTVNFKVLLEEYVQRGQKGIGIWLDETKVLGEPDFFFLSIDPTILEILQGHFDMVTVIQQHGTEKLKKMEIK